MPKSVVPAEHIEQHNRILNARHSVHAHADLTVLDAKLHVAHASGEKYVSRIENYISGLEELTQLQAVIAMTEVVLNRLYALHKASERNIAA